MRKILRDTCVFAALMILTIFTFSITVAGLTDEILLVFQIFGLALVLSIVNYFIDEKTSFPILTSYLIKYFVVSVIVIAFGFVVGWFFPSNFWMAFIYVGVITVIVYALDSVKTEKDIEEINDLVKLSKNEEVVVKPLGKKNGWKVLLVLLIAMLILCLLASSGYVLLIGSNPDIGSYCLNGMAATAVATVILAFILLIYLIADNVHRKKIT